MHTGSDYDVDMSTFIFEMCIFADIMAKTIEYLDIISSLAFFSIGTINNILPVFLVQIGFFTITIWDVLDVIIVSLLLYQVYKLLKGSIAFNIFVGIVALFIIWWLVGFLKMDLLNMILSQFVSLGVIMIVIVFQPEIRKFLLLLGNRTLKGGSLELVANFFKRGAGKAQVNEKAINEIRKAVIKLAEEKTGALIVFGKPTNIPQVYESGIPLHAELSSQLVQSIFQKESPLHDGALLIYGEKIIAAGCILPLSENNYLPSKYGLRHRAALGVSELGGVKTIIVSEETGLVSTTDNGAISFKVSDNDLSEFLFQLYS